MESVPTIDLEQLRSDLLAVEGTEEVLCLWWLADLGALRGTKPRCCTWCAF